MNNETTPILWGGYGSLCNNDTQYHQQNRIYDGDYIAIAITTCCIPYYLIRTMKEEKITCEHIMNLNYYKHEESDRVYSGGGQALPSQRKEKMMQEELKLSNTPEAANLRIRKLTPKECYRLMGFSDLDYERAKEVIPDSMIYHTAGDSIVVNVLMAIFKEMI